MKLFYTKDFSEQNPYLSPEESTHCLRVLRIQDATKIYVTNGQGDMYQGLVNKNGKIVQVDITEHIHNSNPRKYKLHMAVCPTKNIDRFEWFLEKATEIGIDEITPIISFHSERKKLREDRLEKILVSAMKQSLKSHKPVLNPLCTFEEFLSKNDLKANSKLIAHCREDETKIHIKHIDQSRQDILILIGPEGDFSESEIERAYHLGFQPIGLGKSRLRTETAGLAACHAINFLFHE